MKRLFICQKPQQAKSISKLINEEDVIILAESTNSYKFQYPESMKFTDVPYINKDPQYINNSGIYVDFRGFKKQALSNENPLEPTRLCLSCLVYKKEKSFPSEMLFEYYIEKYRQNANIKNIHKKIIKQLCTFSEIIFVSFRNSHTTIRGIDFLFNKHFDIENLEQFSIENNIPFSFITLHNLSDEAIKSSFNKKENLFNASNYLCSQDAYKKKDYFDYNYNLNSLMLLNKAYKITSGKYNNILLTKNLIQTLFLLSTEDEPITKNRLRCSTERNNIGTEASRIEILNQLVNHKLINESFNKVSLSELGIDFLKSLHRKVNDPHLSSRLYSDINNKEFSLHEFKIKYSKYLSNVFSKQKRLLNKY